jgi:hypothetical protein
MKKGYTRFIPSDNCMFLIFIGQEKIRNVATCLLYTLIGSFEIKKEKKN